MVYNDAGTDKVYPRVCGGTDGPALVRQSASGLSPRVRGNRQSQRRRNSRRRSIPACAGEPKRGSPGRCAAGVYPRVCGGTSHSRSSILSRKGLSPRVRGNRRSYPVSVALHRSIPACAGEPSVYHPSRVRPAVYPRVCGGTTHRLQARVMRQGLSPRVRGNLSVCDDGRPAGRSIPACAGEPQHHFCHPTPPTVYPRVCGGTAAALPSYGSEQGLSPRVRGNLL